jgi:hypothetical protein
MAMILFTTRKMVIGLALVLAAAGIAGAVALIPAHNKARQEAAKQAELTASIQAQSEAYAQPLAAEDKLSTLPDAKQAAFVTRAAEYYGVETSGAHGETPAPLEIVGACMRERNIELGRTYQGQSDAAIAANDKGIMHVRQQIAKDCYERYSPDGKLPDMLTKDMHNH